MGGQIQVKQVPVAVSLDGLQARADAKDYKGAQVYLSAIEAGVRSKANYASGLQPKIKELRNLIVSEAPKNIIKKAADELRTAIGLPLPVVKVSADSAGFMSTTDSAHPSNLVQKPAERPKEASTGKLKGEDDVNLSAALLEIRYFVGRGDKATPEDKRRLEAKLEKIYSIADSFGNNKIYYVYYAFEAKNSVDALKAQMAANGVKGNMSDEGIQDVKGLKEGKGAYVMVGDKVFKILLKKGKLEVYEHLGLKEAVKKGHYGGASKTIVEDACRNWFATDDLAQLSLDKARYYHEQGNYALAAEHATEAIRLDPKNAEAYNLRGAIYYYDPAIDTYDKAIVEYTKAIELDPEYGPYYSNRGNAYYQQKEYRKAIADYEMHREKGDWDQGLLDIIAEAKAKLVEQGKKPEKAETAEGRPARISSESGADELVKSVKKQVLPISKIDGFYGRAVARLANQTNESVDDTKAIYSEEEINRVFRKAGNYIALQSGGKILSKEWETDLIGGKPLSQQQLAVLESVCALWLGRTEAYAKESFNGILEKGDVNFALLAIYDKKTGASQIVNEMKYDQTIKESKSISQDSVKYWGGVVFKKIVADVPVEAEKEQAKYGIDWLDSMLTSKKAELAAELTKLGINPDQQEAAIKAAAGKINADQSILKGFTGEDKAKPVTVATLIYAINNPNKVMKYNLKKYEFNQVKEKNDKARKQAETKIKGDETLAKAASNTVLIADCIGGGMVRKGKRTPGMKGATVQETLEELKLVDANGKLTESAVKEITKAVRLEDFEKDRPKIEKAVANDKRGNPYVLYLLEVELRRSLKAAGMEAKVEGSNEEGAVHIRNYLDNDATKILAPNKLEKVGRGEEDYAPVALRDRLFGDGTIGAMADYVKKEVKQPVKETGQAAVQPAQTVITSVQKTTTSPPQTSVTQAPTQPVQAQKQQEATAQTAQQTYDAHGTNVAPKMRAIEIFVISSNDADVVKARDAIFGKENHDNGKVELRLKKLASLPSESIFENGKMSAGKIVQELEIYEKGLAGGATQTLNKEVELKETYSDAAEFAKHPLVARAMSVMKLEDPEQYKQGGQYSVPKIISAASRNSRQISDKEFSSASEQGKSALIDEFVLYNCKGGARKNLYEALYMKEGADGLLAPRPAGEVLALKAKLIADPTLLYKQASSIGVTGAREPIMLLDAGTIISQINAFEGAAKGQQSSTEIPVSTEGSELDKALEIATVKAKIDGYANGNAATASGIKAYVTTYLATLALDATEANVNTAIDAWAKANNK